MSLCVFEVFICMQTLKPTRTVCGVWLEIILIEVVILFFPRPLGRLSHRQQLRCDTLVWMLYFFYCPSLCCYTASLRINCLSSFPSISSSSVLSPQTTSHPPTLQRLGCLYSSASSLLLLLLSFSLVCLSVTPTAAAAAEPAAQSQRRLQSAC